VAKRLGVAYALLAALLAVSSAGATQSDLTSGATARAYGIRVVVPGQPGAATQTVTAPPDAVELSGTFTYGDGGVVTAASANATVSAAAGQNALASASAEVHDLSLFGGEITAPTVIGRARANAKEGAAAGDLTGSSVAGLSALGEPVGPGETVQLADWGTLRTVETGSSNSKAQGYHGFVTALDIRLTADHGGLPAGTEILVGYAEVAAKAAPPPAVPPPVKAPPRAKPSAAPAPAPAQAPEARTRKPPEPKDNGIPPVVHRPPAVTPKLTAGGYVFPVYGPSSFVDTFGAPRGDVSGGWHHGDDIFAPLGAPLLACASGTVFSVGWNEIGGNRLWLRDGQGNEFYYAHLSAFSPLAVNGNHVDAGDVVGFVGNSGDAQGTPDHLHFEIHPVGLLGMGYDGAVDPTQYLLAWKRLQDISFDGGAWTTRQSRSRAPKPGAILLEATDISSADGLDPASLQRALAPASAENDGALLRAIPLDRG
jgi:murein DD-endopeptidase MepM/ murein hydrolase activator NlpD